jgi:hypothetical protein
LEDRGQFAERLLTTIRAWVKSEPKLRGLALVGSYARGEAGKDSDIDLIVLVDDPQNYCAANWTSAITWEQLGARPSDWSVVQYGVTWSKHVRLDNGVEVEFGFAPLSWTATAPLDAGTRQVLSGGCRILYDPDTLFETVCAHLSNS